MGDFLIRYEIAMHRARLRIQTDFCG
jgi:hypothetical protein